MADLTIILYAAALLPAGFNIVMELRRDLMMLQQNSYRRERYMKWLSQSGDSTSMSRLTALLLFFICLSKWCPEVGAVVLAAAFGLINGLRLAFARYKKPLVMTARAARIFATALMLSLAVTGGVMAAMWAGSVPQMLCTGAIAMLGVYCLSHAVILTANAILHPLEVHINRKYIRQAEEILRGMPDLSIIGITGSYGKTTTKHYLHRILSEQYNTLMTPGSFNTPLGVVRTIREQLKPYHQIFIVEMGAKNVGDIRELCDIVRPGNGIITAVGPQHLESFKTIENVKATKFELADALPPEGVAVVNNDFPAIAERSVGNCRCIRYAVKNTAGADYIATDIVYTPGGSSFSVRHPESGWSLALTTPLVGECNIANVLGAVAMAREFGVTDRQIAYAVAHLEQVEHRLSIKRVPGGLTIIDDAFNSNPAGSAMALDVLAQMQSGKRILVTPGMIELGDRGEELNADFGRKAAQCADIVIVVGLYNREAITAGLAEGGMDAAAVHTADSFADAQAILHRLASAGDTVLYENDLPDTFK